MVFWSLPLEFCLIPSLPFYMYYQAVEAGRKRDLRLSTLERLAAAYGLEVYELLTPELRKSRKPRQGYTP
jgi:hypothetical protein